MITQPEKYESYFTDEISSEDQIKCSVLSSVAFFLLGNGYAFFNNYPIHDAISFSVDMSYSWQISLGRFLLPVYLLIRGRVPSPFVILCLSLLYLSLSEYIVVRVLDLKNRLSVILCTAFLSVNVFTLEISSVHQYFADIFLLALLFACLAVYVLEADISVRSLIISLICFFISFGVYPAFITYALCLFALIILKNMINGREKELKNKIPVWFAAITGAGIAYIAASRTALMVFHISPSEVDWSMFSIGRLSTTEIGKSVINNYKRFGELFFNSSLFQGRLAGVSAVLILLFSLSVFLVFARPKVKVITVFLLLLFPLGSRLVNIMTERTGAYRTMYAQFLLLPVLLWLFFIGVRNIKRIRIKNTLISIVVTLSLFDIYKTIAYTNGAFLWQRILYQRTAYHMGQVLEDITDFENGRKDIPVAVIGLFDLDTWEGHDYEKYKMIEGFGPDTGITYEMVFSDYARILGYNLNWQETYKKAVKNTQEVKTMPCYPEKGYIQEVNGYLVVKLSR